MDILGTIFNGIVGIAAVLIWIVIIIIVFAVIVLGIVKLRNRLQKKSR
jgi:hypothetical protein